MFPLTVTFKILYFFQIGDWFKVAPDGWATGCAIGGAWVAEQQ